MGWFRSKSMKYVQITCHQSLVEKVVQELGNKNVFQFLDSNGTMTAVQRSAKHSLFAHALTQIRRCDDMERIIRYLNSEMRRVIDTENENNFFGKFDIMNEPAAIDEGYIIYDPIILCDIQSGFIGYTIQMYKEKDCKKHHLF